MYKPMDLKDAEALAQQQVSMLWPELAGIKPSITSRHRYEPSAELFSQLGLDSSTPKGLADAEEYTFTFKGQVRTPEGYTLPRIARITINMLRGVVKATISK